MNEWRKTRAGKINKQQRHMGRGDTVEAVHTMFRKDRPHLLPPPTPTLSSLLPLRPTVDKIQKCPDKIRQRYMHKQREREREGKHKHRHDADKQGCPHTHAHALTHTHTHTLTHRTDKHDTQDEDKA